MLVSIGFHLSCFLVGFVIGALLTTAAFTRD
jgi:hypothetical protein